MPKKIAGAKTVENRLRTAGVVFERPEDVPPATIREVNRRGFLDMRSVEIAPQVIRDSLRSPLPGSLLFCPGLQEGWRLLTFGIPQRRGCAA